MISAFSNRLAARLPFYYGYVMIPVAMMLQVATSPGQTFAFSAFMPSLRESLEMSDSELSFAYMLGTFLAAFPLSIIGPASDRWGLRWICLFAVGLLGAMCWFASTVTGWFGLLATFFMLRFLGQGSLSLLSANSIAMWFRSKMGRVSAIMSIGTAIAFAWVPGWINDSIDQVGWRSTYRIIGVLVVATIIPMLALLFRERPEDLGQTVDGRPSGPTPLGPTPLGPTPLGPTPLGPTPLGPTPLGPVKYGSGTSDHDHVDVDTENSLTSAQAIRTRAYWILATINTSWAMIGTGVVFYLYTICDQRGLGSDAASDAFKTFGLSMLAGQLIGGVLADFVPLNRMLGVGTVSLCVGAAFLGHGQSQMALHAFAAFFGAGQGALLAVGAVVWVRYFGRRNLGTIRGTVWCATVAGSGVGPLLMGLSMDRWGSFDVAIGGFFATLCVLSIAAWFSTEPQIR